jgi:hypothetical protein
MSRDLHAYRRKVKTWVRQYLAQSSHDWRRDARAPDVLRTLARYVDDRYHCAYPSIRLLAADLGVAERTVRRAIRTLERLGVLLVCRRIRWNQSQTSNAYYFRQLLEGDEAERAARSGRLVPGTNRLLVEMEIVPQPMRYQPDGQQITETTAPHELATGEAGQSSENAIMRPKDLSALRTGSSKENKAAQDAQPSIPNQQKKHIAVRAEDEHLTPWYEAWVDAKELHGTSGADWVPNYRRALELWYGDGKGQRRWRLVPKGCDLPHEIDRLLDGEDFGWCDLQLVNRFFSALHDAIRCDPRPRRGALLLPRPERLPVFEAIAFTWQRLSRSWPALATPSGLYEALVREYVGPDDPPSRFTVVALMMSDEDFAPNYALAGEPAAAQLLKRAWRREIEPPARRSDASRQPYSMPAAGIRGAHPDEPDDDYSAQVCELLRLVDETGEPLFGTAVPEKPNGEGWIHGLRCPGHDDNHPSLAINIRSGGVKCFAGCFGIGADGGSSIVDLKLMALKLSPSKPRSDIVTPASDDSEAVRAVSETTLAAVPSIDELASRRGLSAGRLASQFGVHPVPGGYAIPMDDPEACGAILIRRERPAPSGNFYWRNPHETRISDLIYNVSVLVKTRCEEVFICEGASDVWAVDAAGVPAISFLAGAGTMPSERAIAKLIDHEVRHAVLLYDWDDAGQRGAQLLKQRLDASGITAEICPRPALLAPADTDISDLWIRCTKQPERFRMVLAKLLPDVASLSC